MRQPWQIWLVFLLCLAVVVPAMVWLTVKTIQMDATRETDRIETELARREAELQERVSSALYRMDLKLLPLVAQEATRPHYYYDSFYEVANPVLGDVKGSDVKNGNVKNGDAKGGGGKVNGDEQDADEAELEEDAGEATRYVRLPSPLLFQPPEFVLLHFQIGPDQKISSPQRPEGAACQTAIAGCGISQMAIDLNTKRLKNAGLFFSYESLLKHCPEVKLPQVTLNSPLQNTVSFQSVYSVPAVENFRNQINDNQIDQQKLENELMQQSQKGQNKSLVQRSRAVGRGNEEFNRRRDSTQKYAEQQWAMNNAYGNGLAFGNYDSQTLANLNISSAPNMIREGVMQPMWVDDNLILARRVDGKVDPLVQGCWLDWKSIQTALKAEVADLLPQVEFQPVKTVTDLNSSTALTTIPVQLVVDSSKMLSTLAIGESAFPIPPASGLRMSLLVAWFGLGLATLATALLLHGVMRLSERRAAFVSAVTHELRTPLTTFRMYAEMMAEQMVPPGKQQEYANTLKVQADRLSHLVENVLQYARLERGPVQANNEMLTIENLFSRFSSRLVERANQAEMNLEFKIDETVSNLNISSQPATIEQILFNLVDNSSKYARPTNDNRIEVGCTRDGKHWRMFVRDYGPGIAPQNKKRMFQPFCKSDQDSADTAEGVGLGLALCCRMASSLGGRLYHEDCKIGAKFVLELPLT